jgi:hypothetical protein
VRSKRVHAVPRGDWLRHLAEALRTSQHGDWILLPSWDAVAIADQGAMGMGVFPQCAEYDDFMTRIRRDIGYPDAQPIYGQWVDLTYIQELRNRRGEITGFYAVGHRDPRHFLDHVEAHIRRLGLDIVALGVQYVRNEFWNTLPNPGDPAPYSQPPGRGIAVTVIE